MHIQNATIAGGVGVGTAAEMMLMPYGALIVGFICGAVSTLGFVYLTPFLESRLRIQDTCGIHNLHGIPGIIGAIVGAVTAAYASPDRDRGFVYSFGFHDEKDEKVQGRFQAFGLLLTLAMAMVGGTIMGLILKLPFWGQATDEDCFDDSIYWEMHEEESSSPEEHTHKPSAPTEPVEQPASSATAP